jgi:peptidoglycan/xylan/chitin deacetylase (PgdA/CDA1 family)
MRRKLYHFIRLFLNKKAKGIFTRSLYRAGVKPVVQKTPSSFHKGIVVLSADFEMAWAFRYSRQQAHHAVEMGLLERQQMPDILRLLDQYQIPCTWATVGHLMLEACARTNGSCHGDMMRPGYFVNRNWQFVSGDWYQHDPGTSVQEDPAWYAPDLVDRILQSPVRHEIGCHTFSHIDFTSRHCPAKLAEAELLKCQQLATERGIVLRSMVFPGGTEGNREALSRLGFWGYRKPMSYDVGMPYRDEYGLVAIPSSYGMDKPEYNWSAKTCFKIVKSYLDKAIDHKKVCHLWFHPSMHPWYLTHVFPWVLKYIDVKRKEGKIEILTMGELALQYKNSIWNLS